MKNATVYEKKIRKLLSSLPKAKNVDASKDPIGFILTAILEADTTPKQADKGADLLSTEFTDLNELRVAPVKDIIEVLGREFPDAREKAESVIRAFNGIVDRCGSLSIEYMRKMPKRDLRNHLTDLGLTPYAAALVVMVVFSGHGIPVDKSLIWALEAEEYLYPDSTIAEVQGFMERVVSQRESMAAHQFLRQYVEKNAKAVAKRRKEYDAAKQAAAPVSEGADDDMGEIFPVQPPRVVVVQPPVAAPQAPAAKFVKGKGKGKPAPAHTAAPHATAPAPTKAHHKPGRNK